MSDFVHNDVGTGVVGDFIDNDVFSAAVGDLINDDVERGARIKQHRYKED